jgi:hypothetical protein
VKTRTKITRASFAPRLSPGKPLFGSPKSIACELVFDDTEQRCPDVGHGSLNSTL